MRSSVFTRFTLFPLTLCAALAARAHTPPPATPDRETPVVLEDLVVSASPVARSQADLIGSASVLAGDSLAETRQASLGETLAALPGVSSTYFGPGASRPILRGLGANRVRVLANSTDTLDASNTSPDHAVSVEPFLVKRIEVVRGPAALLYGSAAIGGAVNVIDHRIETELPARPVAGLVDTSVTDNGAGYATGGALDIALAAEREKQSGLVLHLDAFRREADDLEVPGFSGQPGAPKGRLVNSALDSKGASVGLSYVSETLDAGLNYNGFDTRYGVPAEEDVHIVLRQRRLDASADYDGEFGIFNGARAKVAYSDYEHRELEGSDIGTILGQEGFDARFELLHGDPSVWSGALGAQFGRADLSAVGDEAFLPAHTTDTVALFVFQEIVRDRTTWQAGARVEHRRIHADPFASPGGATPGPRGDDRTTLSGSFGAIHALGAGYKLAWNIAATGRAPTGQELYADGPHVGTAAYEIGDADLDDERGLGVELSLRKTAGFVTGSLTGFVHAFDGYIFEQDTGMLVDETNTPDPAGELRLTRFVQRDALFYGAEIEAVWHLHQAPRHNLDLTTALDYVRAREEDGPDLPRIPPLKARLALDWRRGPWHAGADLFLVARQTDTAPGETDTGGYTLLGATLGHRFTTSFATCDLFVRATNLADEEARVHTSFLKDVAPLPGRAITAGVRLHF
jgi:Outer membrane receptor for ferrienterochelin and colicins